MEDEYDRLKKLKNEYLERQRGHTMRCFYLQRDEDVSGVSGTGKVAEGAICSDGRCWLVWLVEPHSMGLYGSIADVQTIHGHDGKTQIVIED